MGIAHPPAGTRTSILPIRANIMNLERSKSNFTSSIVMMDPVNLLIPYSMGNKCQSKATAGYHPCTNTGLRQFYCCFHARITNIKFWMHFMIRAQQVLHVTDIQAKKQEKEVKGFVRLENGCGVPNYLIMIFQFITAVRIITRKIKHN